MNGLSDRKHHDRYECADLVLNYAKLNPINATLDVTEAKQAHKSAIRL